jgi:transposase
MTKFTRSERLAAAQAVEAGDSLAGVGRELGMSPAVVRRSVKLYREHGEAGFLAKKASYTIGQKLEVLKVMHSQGLCQEETAIKFGITGSATIWEWERRYVENGIDGLTPKKKGRRPRVQKLKAPPTPYEQLLAENEYLRAENEYLKKLNALVAEREAREKHDEATE